MSIRVTYTQPATDKLVVVTCRDMIDAGLAIRDYLFPRDTDDNGSQEESHATA